MESLKLQRNINYGSILPIIVFIAGLLSIYFFSSQLYGEGMITMLFSAIFYIFMVIVRNSDLNPPSQFNLILENMSTFLAFGISSILFGIIFYAENVELIFILFIYFFAIASILSVARNWEYDIKESLGMPIAFNGIFFPLFYYMYKFYFQSPGSSIFLIYFLIAGVLTISNYKFLNFTEHNSNQNKSSNKNLSSDQIIQNRIKQREQKEFENLGVKPKQKSKEQIEKEKIDNSLKKQNIDKYESEILEDSILDKLAKKIENLIHRKDNFNTIKNMPSQKELNETLPHRLEKQEKNFKTVNKAFDIKPKPKRKKRLFQKIVGYFYRKFGTDDFNTIKHMPSQKEIEETLVENNIQDKVEDKNEQTDENQNNQIETKKENIPSYQEVKEVFENTENKDIEKPIEKENTTLIQDNQKEKQTEVKPQVQEQKPIQAQKVINKPIQNNEDDEFDFGEYENDFEELKR